MKKRNVLVSLTSEKYQALQKAAADSGMTPDDFIAQLIRNDEPGNAPLDELREIRRALEQQIQAAKAGTPDMEATLDLVRRSEETVKKLFC